MPPCGVRSWSGLYVSSMFLPIVVRMFVMFFCVRFVVIFVEV